MAGCDDSDMSGERAILTPSRKDVFENMEEKEERFRVEKSKVKALLEDSLPEDVDILVENVPDLYVLLLEQVVTKEGIEVLAQTDDEKLAEIREIICD